jgi:hypothetical protein
LYAAKRYEYVAWQVPVIVSNIAYWMPLIVCTV